MDSQTFIFPKFKEAAAEQEKPDKKATRKLERDLFPSSLLLDHLVNYPALLEAA